ncbi:hypothetical protein Tco_1045694 [Tanacetum coccineum]|uniref:Uncharacterized protein n=1 Tax=Tanacetum coccineum TaxID=301880 RepID=A0ABQ5GU22_9ASTR
MVRPSQGAKGIFVRHSLEDLKKLETEGSQQQRILSVKKANRGSCGLGEVGSPGEGYPLKQSAERESRKEQCKSHKCDKLTDEPIILEGTIEDYQVRRILVDGGSSLEIMRNVPPSRNNRPSSNHGKGRKKQKCANGIWNNKMSLAVQRHNRKDRNEEPQSGWLYHPFYDQIPH